MTLIEIIRERNDDIAPKSDLEAFSVSEVCVYEVKRFHHYSATAHYYATTHVTAYPNPGHEPNLINPDPNLDPEHKPNCIPSIYVPAPIL